MGIINHTKTSIYMIFLCKRYEMYYYIIIIWNKEAKVFDPTKAGIPFAIQDEGFYFCKDQSCEYFCHQSFEAMLQGDFSLEPKTEYFLYGAENLQNEITIVMVNDASSSLSHWLIGHQRHLVNPESNTLAAKWLASKIFNPSKEFGVIPNVARPTYQLKATCINSDYYDDIGSAVITTSTRQQKQDENVVFNHLNCGNSNNDNCFCYNENSKIYFESPKTTLSYIDDGNGSETTRPQIDDYICNRYIHCANGLVEYRFESNHLEYEGDCDKNRIQICSFDLDPEFSDSGRVSD